MSGAERTGATEQQIEAAVERRLGRMGCLDESKPDFWRTTQRGILSDRYPRIAGDFVPPGSRIIDAEDAAAIRRVLEDAMRWRANMVNADVTIAATDDDVARLARLGQG